MNMALMTVKHLSYSFQNAEVLSDLSFELKPGSHTAVVGHNGAGKTTLLRCLARVFLSSQGSIELVNKPLCSYSPFELARLVTYLPQHFHPTFPFSVVEFVSMGRYPYLSPKHHSSPKRVKMALELTQTAQLAQRILTELSGGEKNRVLIAAAIAQKTRLMLLDEPLTGMDPKHQDLMLNLFKHLKQNEGLTLLSATHDINTAACMADSILALKAGRLIYNGETSQFMQSEILTRVFDKEFCLVEHPQRGLRMILPG